MRKKQENVYILSINDVDSSRDEITEFTVWSTIEKAIKQLDLVVKNYKESFLNELIEQDEVSFDSDNSLDKPYILIETPENFHFYEDCYSQDNQIEIWITEKVIDEEVK